MVPLRKVTTLIVGQVRSKADNEQIGPQRKAVGDTKTASYLVGLTGFEPATT